MKIVVFGLNHKSAPIEIREKLAFDTTQTIEALEELKNRFHEAEFVLLSTCNRVELYCASALSKKVNSKALTEFLSEFHHIPIEKFQEFMYTYENEDCVRHLLTVASSLDSMVVGEAQIIAQVKESYRLACAVKSTGKILNRLFHYAFTTSKKVYTTTSISCGRVSVAGVAVELAMQLFADISTAKVLVIGAGEMGELIVQHLLRAGCKNITIVNRSHERSQNIAKLYGIYVEKWEEIENQLIGANIAIASAAVQDYLFRKGPFKKIMNKRWGTTLLIIDIAVPRNFEPSINKMDGVYLYSVDDLSKVVERNRKAREMDIAAGMDIVYKNVTDFMDWLGAKDIGPLIGQMKKQFVRISQNELEQFFVGIRQDASCKESLEMMVNRVVNKLLHCVIKNVNTIAKENGAAEAAKYVDSIVQHAEKISSESNNKGDEQS
jgi:glutamyl-tRNA reductase